MFPKTKNKPTKTELKDYFLMEKHFKSNRNDSLQNKQCTSYMKYLHVETFHVKHALITFFINFSQPPHIQPITLHDYILERSSPVTTLQLTNLYHLSGQ